MTLGGDGNLYLAVEREFERVGDQVEDNLFPHLPIDKHGLGQRRRVDRQGQARLLAGGTKAARQVMRQRRQIGRLINRLYSSRFDPREIEQRVDQLLQAQTITLGHHDSLALTSAKWRLAIRHRIVERTEHERQWRAELMTHIREEGGFGTVDLCQGLGALAFLLIGSRGSDRRRNCAAANSKKLRY